MGMFIHYYPTYLLEATCIVKPKIKTVQETVKVRRRPILSQIDPALIAPVDHISYPLYDVEKEERRGMWKTYSPNTVKKLKIPTKTPKAASLHPRSSFINKAAPPTEPTS